MRATAALLIAAAATAAEAVAVKDLVRGKSLRITMIQEPGFINMLGADGFVKPTSQWSGFLVDLLRRVSTEAGFSYTLHSPSGNGGALCAQTNLTGKARQAFYSTQYNCGQADTETAHTDLYCEVLLPCAIQKQPLPVCLSVCPAVYRGDVLHDQRAHLARHAIHGAAPLGRGALHAHGGRGGALMD
eukprot:COSAG01_NODE_4550_length_4932_cov_2.492862_1_plen_187_part_00